MATRKKRSGGDGGREAHVIEAIEEVRREVRELLDDLPGTPFLKDDSGLDFADAVHRYERWLIEEALRIAHGQQKEAARLLHVIPSTLNSMMKRLHIDAKEH